MAYPFLEIEKKWQKYWADNKTFRAITPSPAGEGRGEVKPKYYALDMFPYPSGAGLHVGHPLGYIASDIVSRYKRLKGFNVLHPMGYDSFGLPAEQYAIQTGQHPAVTTENNIARYREQMDKIGFSFDWEREVRTSDPEFYKWTQWIFLKLFNAWHNPEKDKAEPIEKLIQKFSSQNSKVKAGEFEKFWNECSEKEKSDVLMNYRLAYLSESWVNWCPQMGTVLANEEVKDGVSERGGYPVERKLMPQWSLRITAYAERLLNDLDKIDWSESIKESQRNWIGKSEGSSLRFPLKKPAKINPAFTEEMPNFIKDIYKKYGTLPQRLSPQAEFGRIEGGSFHVEATLAAEKSHSANASINSPERQAEQIITLAKKQGCFIENAREKFGLPHAPETVESDAYYIEDGTVTKVNNAVYYNSPLDFLDSYAVWNFLFPETKYTLTGVTLKENKLAFILKQPFIQAVRSATFEEISSELEKMGFEKGNSRHQGFYHPALGIWLRDLNEGNVFMDIFGNVQFIDAYIDIKGKDGKKTIPYSHNREEKYIEVFTTRPDTVFGVAFLTLAPESDLVPQLTTPEQKQKVEAYVNYAKNRSERERQSEVKKVTGEFTGSYAIHPFTEEELPIWIGDYVLAGYGSGAVMGVPAHDTRDFAFAKHFGLAIKQVIQPNSSPEGGGREGAECFDTYDGYAINSDFINGLQVKDAIKKIISEIEKRGLGKEKIQYRLRDAIFGRQRYWGEPIPIYYNNDIPKAMKEEHLPLVLPEVDKYLPTETGEPPLARAKNWYYNPDKGMCSPSPSERGLGGEVELTTMPGWAGSSWYYLRYMDAHNEKEFASREAINYWASRNFGVDLYIGGSEHATGHLLYMRFWTKFLYDLGYIPFDEPAKKLINQGMIHGMSEKVYKSLVGAYDDSGKIEERYLGDIKIPDGDYEVLVSADCIDSVPTIFKYNANVEINLVENNILKIDKYLLWANNDDTLFLFKDYYLYKKNYYDFKGNIIDPPHSKNFFTFSEVEKMSKSKYNVICPDSYYHKILKKEIPGIIEKFGADTLRMYEMFLGPLEQSKPWNTNGISGVFNFLNRFWRLAHPPTPSRREGEKVLPFGEDLGEAFSVSMDEPTKQELKILHKTIKKIQQDIENYSFNTAVSAFMICTNELTELKCSKRAVLEPLVILLSPFAPHIAEELWNKLGHDKSISFAEFPKYNEAFTADNSFAYPVSFNGKMRFNLELSLSLSAAEIEKEVLAFEQTKKYLEGKQPKKVIVVPKKIVNIVT